MDYNPIMIVVQLVVLAFSVIFHEVAHAYVAYKFGDTTAHDENRITLNPLPHIDMFGSIILPLLMIMTQSPVLLGWAKPVPVNPMYFRNPKAGMMWVSFAGPASNLLIAIVGGVLFRVISPDPEGPLGIFLILLCIMNIVLAVFNMLPIPPLDGSKVVARFMPMEMAINYLRIEAYGFIIIYALLYLGALRIVVNPAVHLLERLLLG